MRSITGRSLFSLLLIIPSLLFAQDKKKEALSELFADAAYHHAIYYSPEYRAYWKQPFSSSLTIGANMPGGHVFGQLRYIDAKGNNVPDFSNITAIAGYETGIALPFRSKLIAGIGLGNCYFSFDDDAAGENLREESEMCGLLYTRIQVAANEHLSFYAGAEALRIYTHIRTDVISLQAGIRYTFHTPKLLQKIID